MRRAGGWVRGLVMTAGVLALLLPAGCGGGSAPNTEDRIDQSDMPRLLQACEKFKTDCGRYPTVAEGLQVLVKQPADAAVAAKWAGPYVTGDDALKDPWGTIYQYSVTEASNQQFTRIWSAGPDLKPGTNDDYPPQKALRAPSNQPGMPGR